jgi:hypothetical protein
VATAGAACSRVSVRSVKAFPQHVPGAPAVDPPMKAEHYQLANVADSCPGLEQRTKTDLCFHVVVNPRTGFYHVQRSVCRATRSVFQLLEKRE